MTDCKTCVSWGKTCTREDARVGFLIPCPECGRLTWPNLGVNLPAGAAVSLGAATASALLPRRAGGRSLRADWKYASQRKSGHSKGGQR